MTTNTTLWLDPGLGVSGDMLLGVFWLGWVPISRWFDAVLKD